MLRSALCFEWWYAFVSSCVTDLVDGRFVGDELGCLSEPQSADTLIHVRLGLIQQCTHKRGQKEMRRVSVERSIGDTLLQLATVPLQVLLRLSAAAGSIVCCHVRRTALMHAMIAVRELPPSAGSRTLVSVELRYGMWDM